MVLQFYSRPNSGSTNRCNDLEKNVNRGPFYLRFLNEPRNKSFFIITIILSYKSKGSFFGLSLIRKGNIYFLSLSLSSSLPHCKEPHFSYFHRVATRPEDDDPTGGGDARGKPGRRVDCTLPPSVSLLKVSDPRLEQVLNNVTRG